MEYLEEMKEIQNHLLEFIDSEEENQQNFDDLEKILKSRSSHFKSQELISVLNIISQIVDNHHRGPFFFDKIKQIINCYKEEIKQTFSNVKIYDFFKTNKRMLLLLINEDILQFNSTISEKEIENKDYFYIENLKLDLSQNFTKIPEKYEYKRLEGENDSYICELIRNDAVENFIIYINKNNIPLSMTIEKSIYETNPLFENTNPKLIEYSAFFGSIQILRFLIQNQVQLTQSLWIYAIHGKNPEIIHLLEENQIYPKDESYQECLEESIKCHHNDFALYFKDNFINNHYSNYFNNEIYYGFKYHNFQFIPIECKEKFCFYYAIEFGYYKLVKYYKNIEGLNINEIIILNQILFS